jgi:glycosyltransferase involved in cell wall biosynthesis
MSKDSQETFAGLQMITAAAQKSDWCTVPMCQNLTCFILAKNEGPNIGRCIESVGELGAKIVVLDSGSTDNTREIAHRYDNVEVQSYQYIDHLTAYNTLCTATPPDQFALILDADMYFFNGLAREIAEIVTRPNVQIACAPVKMFWLGKEMKYGSLCPRKPFLFRGGEAYFKPMGHGERLVDNCAVVTTRGYLAHNDEKDFDAYLMSQLRYARKLVARGHNGQINWRDRLRLCSPAMILISPLASLFIRRGIFCGKLGIIYAIDRIIAEAVAFRESLRDRLAHPKDEN